MTQDSAPNTSAELTLSQSLRLQMPAEVDAICVTTDDWRHLQTRVRNAKAKSSWFQWIASFSVGVASSALTNAISLPADGNELMIRFSWTATIVALVVAGIAGAAARATHASMASAIEEITDEMSQIERRGRKA